VVTSLDLVQQPPGGVVGGIDVEDRSQMRDSSGGVVATVVEVGEQESNLGVGAGPGGGLQRRQRLVGAAGVDGGQPQPTQQGRCLGALAQPLPEEQHRLVRPALAQRAPAPRLEAAGHVLAAGGAGRLVVPGPAEALAGAGKLAGRIETDRLVGERAQACRRRDRQTRSITGVARASAPPRARRHRDHDDGGDHEGGQPTTADHGG
jgi:hypothetical protein